MKTKWKLFWDEKTLFAFVISLIVVFIAHGFCFFNLMYSHDSLYFYDTSGLYKIALGRWMYPIIVHSRLMATPLVIGVFSALYLSFTVVLIVKLFNFNKFQAVAVAMILTVNITLTSLFSTYIFDADADCLALLLACFAVYAKERFTPPTWITIIVSMISLVLSLALYQSYICAAAGLFLIVLIKKSSSVKCLNDFKKIFLDAVSDGCIMAIAAFLYLITTKIAAGISGVSLSGGYNGPARLSSLHLTDILSMIPDVYHYVWGTFFSVNYYNNSLMQVAHYILLLLMIIGTILFILQHRNFYSIFFLVVCIALMPLAVGAVYLISMGTIHHLMIYAFSLVYIIPIVLFQIVNNKKVISQIFMTVSIMICLFVGYHNIVYSNGAYTYKKLVYDNTLLHAQNIWKDINSIDGYVEGETEVVFMGSFQNSKAAYISSVQDRYWNVMTGGMPSSITHDTTSEWFYYGILGRNMNISCNDSEILNNEEYAAMPVYPQNGYCKKICGKVIVKMSY